MTLDGAQQYTVEAVTVVSCHVVHCYLQSLTRSTGCSCRTTSFELLHAVSYQAAPDTWLYSKIFVLGNDIPADRLRIVKVERLMSRGAIHVDRSGTFLNYELNTQNMWGGLSFTDTFRCVRACVRCDSVTHMAVTESTRHTVSLESCCVL
jgi:hypothetical protein